MNTLHELKIWPRFFDAVESGSKTFEIRWDDRGFQAGDDVALREWKPTAWCDCRNHGKEHLPDCPRYTGRVLAARIGWVTGTFPATARRGFNGDGYVVLALVNVTRCDELWTDVLAPQPPVVGAVVGVARVAAAGGLS